MGSWLQGQLDTLGVETKLVDLGKHVMDGQELQLPPAILGRIGNDPKKKTVLVYGHYDVQPVSPSLAWLHCEAIILTQPDRTIGRVERRMGHGAVQARRR